VGEYSKGMARRIGLAQALINDPDLLILDEPTTGLDPIGTREIKDLITFLNREKRKTIMLSSHLLGDVEDVCQRITVLYGGRRQTVGPVGELLKQQDLTQITTEKLSDEALARIRNLIETEEDKQVLDVRAPSDKLETFFLRIVREAQQTQQRTSGVTASGQIAEFLAAPEGEAVVESLIAAAETTPEAPDTEPASAPAVETPAAEVIDDLVSPAAAPPASPAPVQEPTAPARPVDEQADRSVIDDLIAPGRDEDTDPASKE
jgi:ABC-2 type transport system ATP-binding protein